MLWVLRTAVVQLVIWMNAMSYEDSCGSTCDMSECYEIRGQLWFNLWHEWMLSTVRTTVSQLVIWKTSMSYQDICSLTMSKICYPVFFCCSVPSYLQLPDWNIYFHRPLNQVVIWRVPVSWERCVQEINLILQVAKASHLKHCLLWRAHRVCSTHDLSVWLPENMK